MSALETINAIIRTPALHDYLAVLKGARNGLVYGAKIRFPHALVMALLFHRGSFKAKATFVLKATKQHALNLAQFVTLYKSAMLLQRRVNGGKERSLDSFVAGLIGGWLTFGERNAVNEQIVLYVSSRVVASFLPRLSPTPTHSINDPPPVTFKPVPPMPVPFAIFASLAWATVMWIFRTRPETLQGGMSNSMLYLYTDSSRFTDLRTLLWHNK